MKFHKKAQGTIEYMIIIGIVIVISLVVVGFASTSFENSSTQVSSSSSKITNLSPSGIVVSEAVADERGNSMITLKNNGTEPVVLSKVAVGTNETYFNEQIVGGSDKSFSLSDLNLSCPCDTNQKSVSCTFDFYLTTSEGLEKYFSTKVSADCLPAVIPKNPEQVVGLGTGTLANPWIINSCRELQNMNQHLDGNYALRSNISCSETSTWNSGTGFSPVGTDTNPFRGNFNGRGYTISNITINRPTEHYLGLFGYIDGAAEKSRIENLKIEGISINGDYYIGLLTGYLKDAIVSNVQTSGSAEGWSTIAGIASVMQDSNIYQSSSTCTFNSNGYPGYNVVGGLVGFININSYIDESFAEVDMTMQDAANGGLAAWFTADQNIRISNSYTKGIINTPNEFSGDYTAGISGPTRINNAIYNSYTIVNMGPYASGCLYGYDYGNAPAINSFYNSDICTTYWSGDRSWGRTTAELKDQSTFTNAGWDFTNIWEINPSVNDGYPHLKWE